MFINEMITFLEQEKEYLIDLLVVPADQSDPLTHAQFLNLTDRIKKYNETINFLNEMWIEGYGDE